MTTNHEHPTNATVRRVSRKITQWKLQVIESKERPTFTLPLAHTALAVHTEVREGRVCVWFDAFAVNLFGPRYFRVFLDQEEVPAAARHIGTCLDAWGRAWHVFETYVPEE